MKLNLWIIVLLIEAVCMHRNANFTKLLETVEIDKDVKSVTHVLLDIVDKFLVQEKNEFNIVVYIKIDDFSTRILDKFLTQTKLDYRTRIEYHKIQKLPNFLTRSSILLFNSIEDFYVMHLDYNLFRYQNQPFKFFIFIPGLSFDDLKSHRILKLFKRLTVFEAEIINHSYFIVNEDNFVILASVEYFSPKVCNQAHLVILNKFNKITSKWTLDLKNHEKYLQYHGCELVLMLPTPYRNGVNLYPSGYALFEENLKNFNIHGITPVLFGIAAKAHNFIDSYQPVVIQSKDLLLFTQEEAKIVSFTEDFKIPHVFLFTISIRHLSGHFRHSNAFMDLRFSLYVTPADAYTPYEKLFLPFDLTTWIFLLMTFLVAFTVIFIVNKLSKVFQELIYGQNVYQPLYNVVGIFFGISQSQLPKKDFPRFLLALFLMFCLVFRTCYQNKLFEFMTSEPRRSLPKTRADLIDRNYTVHSMIVNPIINSATDENERSLNVQHIKYQEFYDEFETQSLNASAKLCLCVDELFQNELELRRSKNYYWYQLSEPLYTSHEAFGLLQNSFALRMFKRTVDRLIDTGVMKYLSNEHYTRKRTYYKVTDGPKVLGLEDLGFGFNIWFGCCCLSALAFVIEIVSKKLRTERKKLRTERKKPRKIKFAKVHPLTGAAIQVKSVLKSATLKKFRIKKKIKN